MLNRDGHWDDSMHLFQRARGAFDRDTVRMGDNLDRSVPGSLEKKDERQEEIAADWNARGASMGH